MTKIGPEPGGFGSKLARRPHILVFAYGCDPRLGSEEGAGWGLVRTLGEFADCTVLVSPDHSDGLEQWKAEHSAPWLSYVAVPDLPFATRAKEKWHRIIIFLFYLVWLLRAYRVGRRLHTECPFDGTYHATYSAYWLPTPASRFGIPCVWGPVGGAVTTPLALWRFLGWAGVLGEILDMVAVRIVSWWPGTRRTWWTAKERIVQNEETLQRLPEPLREHCHILNHVLFAVAPTIQTRPRKTHVLSIAPLDARKGLRLLIHAMAHTRADIHLIVVGDGPDRNALQRLTRRLRLTQRIEFLGHVPREELFELLAEAAAVVFTGLREEGGMGLAEAMLAGAPVIVLANGGARTIAALGTDPDRARLIQPATAEETVHRLAEAMTDFSRNPPASTGPTLDQKAARKAFEEIFRNALVSHLAEC